MKAILVISAIIFPPTGSPKEIEVNQQYTMQLSSIEECIEVRNQLKSMFSTGGDEKTYPFFHYNHECNPAPWAN